MKLYKISDEYLKFFDSIDSLMDAVDDDTIINNRLEELDDKFNECAEYIGAQILNAELDINSIREVHRTLGAKIKKMERKQEWYKNYLKWNMQKIGKNKIKSSDSTFSISITKGRESVCIEDESKIPDKYLKITKTPIKIDILEALKSGEVIDGTSIISKPFITIH